MARYYTTAEAAQYLAVSQCRVRQFCEEGRLGEKIGRNWAITAAELAAFARRKRRPGNPNLQRRRTR